VPEVSEVPPSNQTPFRLCDNKMYLHKTLKLPLKNKVLNLLSSSLCETCTGLFFDVIITPRNNFFVSDDANHREFILFAERPYEHPASKLLL